MKEEMKRIFFLFSAIIYLYSFNLYAQTNNSTGFFMWDEATSSSVVEDAISRGVTSFRSRDLTILYTQPAWNVFKAHGNELDVMVAIPVYYTYTTTPVDLVALADTINKNPFIRRLQIYPELQPGLMNPSELNPCNDWLTGYANQFEQRIRQLDQLVTDKSVEILVAGQLGTPGCSDLTQIVNTLYDLQSTGRNVAWAVTVYPYYYGTQDPSLATLTGDINGVLNNLSLLAPAGKQRLPLRVIESGWPSECSAKATLTNHCTFAQSAFNYSSPDAKIYYFELQDFSNGWSECEKHFGLYDAAGNLKCPSVLPLTWESVTATFIDGMVVVKWFISNEKDNKEFVIERSVDARTFKSIGIVSDVFHPSYPGSYQYIDHNPIEGVSYYRIKQVDHGGSFSYSPIRAVSNSSNEPISNDFAKIYPNPASIHDVIALQVQEDVQLELYNDLGQCLLNKAMLKGITEIQLMDSSLPTGIYHVVLIGSKGIQYLNLSIMDK